MKRVNVNHVYQAAFNNIDNLLTGKISVSAAKNVANNLNVVVKAANAEVNYSRNKVQAPHIPILNRKQPKAAPICIVNYTE